MKRVLLLSLVSAAVASGAAPEPPATGDRRLPVLELRAEETLALYGALELDAVFVNEGNDPIPFGDELVYGSHEGLAYRLLIRDPSGAERSHFARLGRGVVCGSPDWFVPPEVLDPGERRVLPALLMYRQRSPREQGEPPMEPVFGMPGEHHVTAVCSLHMDARVESETIIVRVLEPPDSAAAVVEAVGKMRAVEALYDYGRLAEIEGAAQELEELVARFPATLYADYARLSLARRCLGLAQVHWPDDRPGERSRAELAADARALLESIRSESFTMKRELASARKELDALDPP